VAKVLTLDDEGGILAQPSFRTSSKSSSLKLAFRVGALGIPIRATIGKGSAAAADPKTPSATGPFRRFFMPPEWAPLFACLSTEAGRPMAGLVASGECWSGVLPCFLYFQTYRFGA
jgi:hypothetical protein